MSVQTVLTVLASLILFCFQEVFRKRFTFLWLRNGLMDLLS